MHIGILGGSFDPPHIGHILIAQQVVAFSDIETVWFMPAYQHTFGKQLSPATDRFRMTQLLNVPHTQVSSLEIDHKLSGNTIDLIPILHKSNPGDTFVFIIGSDQLPGFEKWGEWERLVEEIEFLVVPRPEYPCMPLYANMKVLKHPLLIGTTISSSLIRKRVLKGVSIDYLVPQPIAAYIRDKKLYRKKYD